MSKTKLQELVHVYEDLERTLKSLRGMAVGGGSLKQIDLKKLVAQLSRSKRKLERKIGNTFLLEKEHLRKKLETFIHKN